MTASPMDDDPRPGQGGGERGADLALRVGDDFGALFTSFSRTAQRLESRDRYRSEVEDEVTRRFVNGEPDDLSWSKDWFDLIRRLTGEGKRFQRVRVVSVPLSDYQRAGVFAIAPANIEAGEDIRYLDRAEAAGVPDEDFWLFDFGRPDARAARLLFDERDQLLGAEIITDLEVMTGLARVWARAFERALPPGWFAEVHGLARGRAR